MNHNGNHQASLLSAAAPSPPPPAAPQVSLSLNDASPTSAGIGGGPGSGGVAYVDVAALTRHRTALAAAVKEVTTLKSVVKALESTIEQLQHERNLLLDELRESKKSEAAMLAQIEQLSAMCERLTDVIQRCGVETAHRAARLEAQRREADTKARVQIERLSVQLLSTQNPLNTSRAVPWSKIQTIDGHPALVLRDVVIVDAKREAQWLKGCPDSLAPDPAPGVEDALERLASVAGAFQKDDLSEESATWRSVLRRIYTVLKDRRRVLSVDSEVPSDSFLLRTRHEMIGCFVQLHNDTRRCAALLAELMQRVETALTSGSVEAASSSSASSGITGLSHALAAGGGASTAGFVTALESQIELLCTCVADMDDLFVRVRHTCFSDADVAFHDPEALKERLLPGAAPNRTAAAEGSPAGAARTGYTGGSATSTVTGAPKRTMSHMGATSQHDGGSDVFSDDPFAAVPSSPLRHRQPSTMSGGVMERQTSMMRPRTMASFRRMQE